MGCSFMKDYKVLFYEALIEIGPRIDVMNKIIIPTPMLLLIN